MSWMDSWSRPTKHAATPPPLYLTAGGEAVPYCHTCGRVISTRKSHTTKAASTPAKYCSDRCRHNKPSQAPDSLEGRITDAFIALLDGKDPSDSSQDVITSAGISLPTSVKEAPKKVKGETRITVSCAEVEALIFGPRQDPEKVFGRRKNRAKRGVPDPKEWKSVDMEDKDDAPEEPFRDTSASSDSEHDTTTHEQPDMISLRVRPPQSQSDVNGSIGGEKGWAEKIYESPQMLQKRLEGQKRADERELVRCAARRLCAFGIVVDNSNDTGKEATQTQNNKGAKGMKKKGKGKDKAGEDDDGVIAQERMKKCEAVMSGSVVEASYAKGEWGIRWRE